MNREQLLQELEPLTHDQRSAHMIELGRRVAEETDVATLLDDLEKGGFYERRLALASCFTSRDGARVARYIDDPSKMLRGLALRLAVLACDDETLQRVFETAHLKTRRFLLIGLRKRRRLSAIDRFLEALSERGDAELDRFLAYGSPEFVGRHIEDFFDKTSGADWTRLARYHPELAARTLLARLQAVQTLDQRLISRVNSALPALVEHNPAVALSVVEAVGRNASLSTINLQCLAERAPNVVIDLLLAGSEIGKVFFQNAVKKIELDRLLWLVEHRPQAVNVRWFWRRLPREVRTAVYRVARLGWRSDEGLIDRELLEHLERPEREAEARRHLGLPVLATRPAQRLPYAALLPWDEARQTLEPFIRNPDPDLRSVALASLIFAARYHRDRLPELLDMILARRNEQDPIRGVMLAGLQNLPQGAWQEEHLEPLSQIIRQALDAADLSYGTAACAESLIVALLPRYPAWGAEWLATLVRERGRISLGNLGIRLTKEDVRRIAAVLMPVLLSWEATERQGQIINVAQSLGKRLEQWDELIDLLERVLDKTWSTSTAEQCLNLIALYRRRCLPSLIPAVLAADASWVTRPVVHNYLHRRRQDLLTPLLGQYAHSGRFSSGLTHWVLPFKAGFTRWTPRQQHTFEKTLNRVVQDPRRDTPALLYAIGQLAAMPDIEPVRLMNLADARNPKIAIRDAALRALGRLDAGQGIPFLIESMGDDRARIAIYALRASMLAMPEGRALELLRVIPLEKVTVAKEVVRLLGELKSDEAFRELVAINERDLHRDVHVAFLRALWDHLERDETWLILEQAARSQDPAIATMAGRTPADRLTAGSQRRLVALVAGLLGHPDPIVRTGILGRCSQMPLRDHDELLLQPIVAALESRYPDEYLLASQAVLATYAGRRAALVGAAVTRILPHRRPLVTLVRQLVSTLNYDRTHMLPTARAVLNSLAADTLTGELQVELAVAALPAAELIKLLQTLARNSLLYADVLVTAKTQLHGASSRYNLQQLESIEAALAADSDPPLRRLALAALVAQSNAPRGWSPERLARLQQYRSDPSPLVAAAAQFRFVPDE